MQPETRIPRISDICMHVLYMYKRVKPINYSRSIILFLIMEANKIPVLAYCPESVFPRLLFSTADIHKDLY